MKKHVKILTEQEILESYTKCATNKQSNPCMAFVCNGCTCHQCPLTLFEVRYFGKEVHAHEGQSRMESLSTEFTLRKLRDILQD